ncbi:MAG TPA: PIG-L family deacetylase [Silvibacterium sp.]|nr:PIG-L family deacetylase [Silvibacterium sp.]
MAKITRREILGQSPLLAASLGAKLPFSAAGAASGAETRKLNIVVVGGHPDDPESGCGGTIALYTAQGHNVVILYLTRGEAGIVEKTAQQAAAIRTAECEKACSILKARAVFAGQIDGNTEVNPARYADFRKLLDAENPDIVFTHWPVDSHRDHRAASLLTYDAWLDGGRKFDLYYFEVDLGEQTQNFHPTDYVDIAHTYDVKKDACFAHASQQPATTFWPLHERMARFRGMESGVEHAEAFISESQNRETGVLKKA